MPLNPRVTIRDIAEKSGLHFTTVSLALRNSPRLKAATRDRVNKLAKEMGYRPDPMLAALNAYRQTTQSVHYQASIAWVHNWPNPKNLYNCEEFNQYYQGACERALERGYVVEEFWLREPGMNVEKFHRILKARNIQGVLLAPQPESGVYLPLAYDELSAVAFGYSMRPAVLHVVTNHHVHTMNLLLEKILELGYRRIGLCIPRGWNAKVENAWQSCMLLLQNERPDLAAIPIIWDDNEKERAEDKQLAVWIRKHRPDVVISFNDVVMRLIKLGFKIPEDLAFVSPFVNQDDTYLSGVYQNDRLIGRKAVDIVIDMLHRGETGIPATPVRTLVEGIWCPGQTLSDRNRRPVASAPKVKGPKNPGPPKARGIKIRRAKLQVARS